MKSNHTYVTDSNFNREVLESSQPVLVHFWADWCSACTLMNPVLEELASTYSLRIATLDTEQNTLTAIRFSVRNLPALLYFKDGKLVDKLIGVLTKDEVVEQLGLPADRLLPEV